MELIETLLSTPQSDDFKSSVSYKLILKTVSQPMNSLECRKVFFKLTDWIISSEQKYLRENALTGFNSLADNSLSVFLEVVDINYFKIIFNNMQHSKPVSTVGLVITIFSKLNKSLKTSHHQENSFVRTNLVSYLSHHCDNHVFLQSLEHLYTMFPSLLPVSTQDVTMLGNVVIHLHSSHPSNCQCEVRLDKLLSHVWISGLDRAPCLQTLSSVFQVLSSTATSSPPACLSAILEALPADFLDQNLSSLLDQSCERLMMMLTRVFAWLSDREAPYLMSSLLKFLPELGVARGSLLSSLTETCLARLLVQLLTEATSTGCRHQLALLARSLLYGDQNSPAALHSVVLLLPVVMEVLAKEELWQTRLLLLEAAHYLSVLFPGVVANTQLQNLLQEDKNLPEMSLERRHQLAGRAWAYPGNIKLVDRMPGQLVGLVNLGNTCYVNSILQALFSTQMFQSQVTASCKRKHQPVFSSLQRVFRCLRLSRRSSVSPRQFLDISRPPWFDVGHQQDCSEFLTFLMHCLEEEGSNTMVTDEMELENYTRGDGDKNVTSHESGVDCGEEAGSDPSLVQSLFGGQLTTYYHCLVCTNISEVDTSFTDLHLPIPLSNLSSTPDLNLPYVTITRTRKQLSVSDLLQHYFEPEDLSGENQYQCDKCEGLRDAVKTTQIKAIPKHLIITLLRFKYDASMCRKIKLLIAVDCPSTLSLPVIEGELVSYQLYCVVVHTGLSSEGGHYYTWVRNDQRQEWVKVSDEDVETEEGIWDQETLSRRETPYMLFYRREGVV